MTSFLCSLRVVSHVGSLVACSLADDTNEFAYNRVLKLFFPYLLTFAGWLPLRCVICHIGARARSTQSCDATFCSTFECHIFIEGSLCGQNGNDPIVLPDARVVLAGVCRPESASDTNLLSRPQSTAYTPFCLLCVRPRVGC